MRAVRHLPRGSRVGSRLLALLVATAALPCAVTRAQDLTSLPPEPEPTRLPTDWLVDPDPYPARLLRSADGLGVVLSNGLVRRELRLEPGVATVALDDLVGGRAVLRAVEPEARLVLDGRTRDVGGLLGQPNRAFLRPTDLAGMQANPDAFGLLAWTVGEPEAPFGWERVRHHDRDAAWPPPGVRLTLTFGHPDEPGIEVRVVHELYDGLPCLVKWLEVENRGERVRVLERFSSERLAAVERESRVESREGVPRAVPNLWVETDYATGGAAENGQRFGVHWREDPDYTSQVSYLKRTLCLLEVGPEHGPQRDLAPGEVFRSMRSFVLVHDGEDRARNGLARCRMYRTIAPWVTENPLMMHVRVADREHVTRAIDQCAEVGFEMVILTFGSGFDVESTDPAYLAELASWAAYARSKGIELGGYSLFSSRSVGGGNDVVSPPGESPAHGSCPAVTSDWSLEYHRKLREFYSTSGFTLLEHDGPYPGDRDVTARPPLQKGAEDSRWVQFWLAADFYRWCRARGIYLNTPDWYHLNGSTKSAMGYREVNWSLPREEQVLHARQNIFDGTWDKTPGMGWMFVPLTEYHGGGPAATVEPLHEHLDHYRAMLRANLGAGVQACYRGPRLYDTDATRDMLAGEVRWFLEHREVLEADIDHGASRRADGRDLDWLLHVNPGGREAAFLTVFNPTDRERVRELELDLRHTGLVGEVRVDDGSGSPRNAVVDGRLRLRLEVRVPAGGSVGYALTQG